MRSFSRLFFVLLFVSIISWSQLGSRSGANQFEDSLDNQPIGAIYIEDSFSDQSCNSSRDCLPASEHCLSGECALRSSQCYNNFDCNGLDKCTNGVCSYM